MSTQTLACVFTHARASEQGRYTVHYLNLYAHTGHYGVPTGVPCQ